VLLVGHHAHLTCASCRRIAAPAKFEVKRLGALEHSSDDMVVTSSGYSASNFTGSAIPLDRIAAVEARSQKTCNLYCTPHHPQLGHQTPSHTVFGSVWRPSGRGHDCGRLHPLGRCGTPRFYPARLSLRRRVLPLNQTTLCWHTSSSHKQAVELSSEHPVYEFPDSPGLTGLSGRPMSLRG
jgi:hypothetical protein